MDEGGRRDGKVGDADAAGGGEVLSGGALVDVELMEHRQGWKGVVGRPGLARERTSARNTWNPGKRENWSIRMVDPKIMKFFV